MQLHDVDLVQKLLFLLKMLLNHILLILLIAYLDIRNLLSKLFVTNANEWSEYF